MLIRPPTKVFDIRATITIHIVLWILTTHVIEGGPKH